MYIIGGKHKKRRLAAPKSKDVRPSASQLREALFNICQQFIEESRFLDLFAGSGAIGLEALSRGASHATFVEKNRPSLVALKQNIAHLQEEKHTQVLSYDAFDALKKLIRDKREFDIIFADPPYGTEELSLSNKVLEVIAESSLLAQGGHLFLEDALEASQGVVSSESGLELVNTRRYGGAILREYVKVR